MTILFADIKGSMDMIETLDPEEARAIVDPALKLMIDAVHNYDGYVAQTTGDGIFALFGAPLAHEDDPQRGLHAALRMQEDLQRHFAKLKESGQAPIKARVGVHTGEVVVRSLHTAEGHDEYVPIGHSIGLAARMQALAPPGSIVVTDATRRLCEGNFNFRSLGPTKVKGVSETVDIYEVIGLGPLRRPLQRSAARGLTRFIGRDDEMRTLWNRWELAREGEGQVVVIAGEAGIGKSRVVHQFHERLAGTSHRWAESAAEPYFQNTPFHAVVAIVKQALALNADLTPDECLNRLEGVLQQNGINPSESAAPIAQVLNLPAGRYPESTLSPERARKRLLATLVKALFALAAPPPMVLALEDLHWADASTLEFLELLVDQAATAPVMVLLTTRPEFEAPWPTRAHHAQITLGRLRDHEVREMVAAVAAKATLTTQAFEAVRSRASGVPLFVEELTRAVLERGGSDASREIPKTLQHSLMARLDRLGPAKEVAQVASVIGREFSYELLHAVSTQTEDELQSALAKLTEAELIYTRGILPEASYQFKHALVQDAAYEALLKSRRRVLHRRVAETLVEKFPAVADTQPELLARHWTEAGVAEPAVAAWREAGRQAVERFANAEAVANLSRALEVLNNLPESNERDTLQVIKEGSESADRDRQEFEIYLEYLAALSFTHGFTRAEVAVAHSRAQELCERLGETSRMYAVLQGSAGFHLRRGEYKKLHDCATRILELSDNAANPTWAVSAHYLIGHSLCCLGDLAKAHEHLDLASRLVGASPSPDIATSTAKVCALAVDALTLWTWGYPDRARAKLDELLIFADATKNPYDLAIAIIYAHIVTLFRREFAQALTYAEQGLKVASEKQFEWLETSLIWSRDACRILAGASCDITKPQAAFKVYFGSEAKLYKPDNCTVLAECCGVLGQAEVGLPMIEEAFSAMNENDERRCEPETWRVKGLLLHQLALSRGESGGESEPLAKEAESCFIRAIELANRRQSRSWELRAALTFGKILVQSGRRREAREILVPIHKAFTEGFDTPDFVEASTLLDEVRSA